VLLPAPFSPTRACTSPNSALNDASASARTPPKDREISIPSIAGLMIGLLSVAGPGGAPLGSAARPRRHYFGSLTLR